MGRSLHSGRRTEDRRDRGPKERERQRVEAAAQRRAVNEANAAREFQRQSAAKASADDGFWMTMVANEAKKGKKKPKPAPPPGSAHRQQLATHGKALLQKGLG